MCMLVVVCSSCSTVDVPAAPKVGEEGYEPALAKGQRVYSRRCANCHGSDGGGGLGPALNAGAVAAKYPNVADQINLVTSGYQSMPGFKDTLTTGEIKAVVEYTRKVL